MPPVDSPRPFLDHLDELRRRLIHCVVWFIFFSGLSYFFVDSILNWLARPVGEFVFTTPTEALLVRFKIMFGMGSLLAFPVFLFHLWRFIGVALQQKEKSIVMGILPISSFLFFLGMAIALLGVAPVAVKFLLTFGSPTLRPLISIQAYLSFLFWMIMGFGLLFQLPLIIVVLCRVGVVRVETLARYRRHVGVGLLIASAVLTPGPDVFSQLLLFIPSYFLFELSLLVSRRFSKGTAL